MKKTSSVSFKLLSCIVVLLALYSFSIFTIVYRQLNSGLEEYVEEEIQQKKASILLEMDTASENVKNTMTWFVDSYVLSNTGDEINTLFANTLCNNVIKYFHLDTVTVVDKNGKQVTSPIYGKETNAAAFKSALSGIEDYTLADIDGNIYAIGIVPIKVGNNVIGAVIGKQCISNTNFVSEIKKSINTEFTIFNGYVRQYTTLDGMKGTEIADKTIIDRVMKGEQILAKGKIANTPYLTYYYPLKANDGSILTTLFIGEPLSVVENLTNGIFKPLLIAALVIAVLALGLVVFVMYKLIIQKLTSVGKSIANLSSGEADLTYRIPVKGHDEFAELGENVNKFIELLQGIVQKLNDAQVQLARIGENLGTNAQESASATAEIMANIDSVRKQTQAQTDAVSDTSTVLSNSSQSVEILVNLVNDQVAGITESSAAIEEMLGNIKSVTNSVRKMAEAFGLLDTNVNQSNVKIENVSSKVTQMSEQSQMLLQANNMISQVASQTNLLAMNAAIEAAHAGEAGKGFSVVADEIRKLAETSSAQSKNINVELKDISASIQDVVVLSKDSQTSFAAIVEQLNQTDQIMRQIDAAMTEQEQASQQILIALNEMKSQATQVNDKSLELKTGVNDVTANMSAVLEISNTISGSMDEMAAGSQQINTAAQSVSELANQTKDDIQIMDGLLGQFRV